jgi:hypothetical protein
MKERSELDAVASKLETLLARYATRQTVWKTQNGKWLCAKQVIHSGEPLALFGVRRGKNYVSYHMVPVYMFPLLANGISPELKRRRQGKACFNFAHVDEALFRELRSLTDASLKTFRDSAFYKQALSKRQPSSKRQSSATKRSSGRPTPSAR